MRTVYAFRFFSEFLVPAEDIEKVTDLGSVDGVRYFSVEEGLSLPALADAEIVTLSPEVRDQLPLVKDIDRQTQERIRARYSLEDELKALRTGDTTVGQFIEECVAEGRSKKAALGL